jgi:hypothetical protein
MKISKTMWVVATAGSLLFAGFTSQAVPIVGGISMSGNVVPTGNLDSGPVSFVFPTAVGVTSVSGSYLPVPTGLASPPVTYNPFSAVPASVLPMNLWHFVSGGLNYSFDLGSMSIISRGIDINGNPFINLQGAGILKITGFTDTAGSWLFTANSASSTFSFSSSNGAFVPDGGTTAMLLGSALALLGMARRYFKA